jgi:GNAT superfamily N-acetyltransferase
MADVRPMRESDVMPVARLAVEAGQDLERRLDLPVQDPPGDDVLFARYVHPVRTDPDGCFVAEDEEGMAACALAFRRDDVWILSQLAVRPDVQSAGLGRAILQACHGYADGAKGRLIAASPDPRALRAYARLGLDAHPCVHARGVPHAVTAPAAIRTGDAADIPFTEAVDRHVRHAAHGRDMQVLLDTGQTLLVADERGYAVVGDTGSRRLLAAFDEDGARELLRAVLARAGDREVGVNWITGRQQWAVEVCMQARMELRTDTGALFIDGDVGPFHPYLPSGAYL